MSDQPTTSGVQELIERLSQEGVAEGQRQAETILADAQRKADEILESARRQAAEMLQQARHEVDTFKAGGEEALRLAARDTLRDFGARIHDGFRGRLQELVRRQLQDPQLIIAMILEITRQATAGLNDKQVEVLLPPEIITEQAALERIEAGEHDVLTEFVEGLIAEDLRQGFRVGLGSRTHAGFTVRVADDKLEIDLSEEAISEFLLLHLLPRFRATMRKS